MQTYKAFIPYSGQVEQTANKKNNSFCLSFFFNPKKLVLCKSSAMSSDLKFMVE